ncbi:MAG TPA: hypothetical protein VMD48_13275 [Solirubrobacteraceae bacterium]|nr:hypothetical protein [Solirubrobacteraceae bacterium]
MKRILLLTVIVVMAVAGAALAARPHRGATYTGRIERASNVTFPISFTVSKSGKKVSSFKLPDSYPVYCQGGGFPALGNGGSGAVANKGTFTVRLPLRNLRTNAAEGSLIVSGKFGAGASASGKVRTDIAGSAFKTCNGTSPFTAKT